LSFFKSIQSFNFYRFRDMLKSPHYKTTNWSVYSLGCFRGLQDDIQQ